MQILQNRPTGKACQNAENTVHLSRLSLSNARGKNKSHLRFRKQVTAARYNIRHGRNTGTSSDRAHRQIHVHSWVQRSDEQDWL